LFKPATGGTCKVGHMNKQNLMALGVLAACIAAAGAKPPADDATAKMAAFDWLAGHWCMEKDGQVVEENWLPARGGMLLSVGRTVAAGRVSSFEFLRIELRDGVVTFVAQPNGTPPTAFRLTAAGADWARFENPQHDFPRRVEYRRTGAGLHAEIAGPGEGGGERVIPFDYRPCGAKT
jgi:hypothetical protein